MTDINHVVLVGRLVRDAELKYTASGQAVCKFSIAVNRSRKNGDKWEDEANFFDIVLWGKRGESLNQYLLKGKAVGVDGELRQERWEQNGEFRSRVNIIANNIQLFASGQPQENSGRSPPGKPGAASNQSASEDSFTDDIPF